MTPTRMERFMAKVAAPDPVSGCWNWTGAKAGKGYGNFWNGEKLEYAHRFAYRNLVGPITKPMLDHLCRNIACCNPAHLEPVTCSENLKRGASHGGHANATKTHCPRGHEYGAPGEDGTRRCKPCLAAAQRKRNRRLKGLPEDTPSMANAAKTQCKQGHPLSGDNVYWHKDGSRDCIACRRTRKRRAKMTGYWYLGTMYSLHPHGLEAAHVMAARAAASLIRSGVNVYSPIVHGHPLSAIGGLDPTSHELWLRIDRPFMEAAKGLIVLKSEGWEQSYGIGEERKAFQQMGKPIAYLEDDFHHAGAEAVPALLRR